jgi:hypothetical protein
VQTPRENGDFRAGAATHIDPRRTSRRRDIRRLRPEVKR